MINNFQVFKNRKVLVTGNTGFKGSWLCLWLTINGAKVLGISKNVPTNPTLWSRAKSLAKSKFDVYPSAYANGWAAKWYKSKGGGWKKA